MKNKKIVISLIIPMLLLFSFSYINAENKTEEIIWTEELIIKEAINNNTEIKKLEMDLELLKLSEKDIKDLHKMDLDQVIDLQYQNPYRSKSKAEIRTEANISKYVTPLEFELNMNALKRQIEMKKLETKKDIKSLLFDIKKLGNEIKNIELAVRRSEETYKNISKRLEQGLQTKFDVNNAKYSLDMLDLQKEMIENNYQIKIKELNSKLGEELAIQIDTINSVSDIPNNKVDFGNMNIYMEKALKNRPDYLMLKEKTDILEMVHEIYHNKYSLSTEAAIKLKKEKEFDYNKSLLDLKDKENEIKLQIEQYISYIVNLYKQLDLQKSAIENSRNSYTTTNLLLKNGMATYDQVLAAELQIAESEKKYNDLEYEISIALAQFELLLGTNID